MSTYTDNDITISLFEIRTCPEAD